MSGRALAFAVAGAIAIRLLLIAAAWAAAGRDAFLTLDSRGYLAPAESIAHRLAFEDLSGRPMIFRTPGYPLLLAIGAAAGQPVAFALILQLTLSGALVVLTHALARQFAIERAAIAAALAVAFEPVTLFWSIKVMAETLLAVCVLAFVAAALRALATGDVRWTIAAAALLCAAAYVKPIAYPLVMVVCAGAWFPLREWRRGAIVVLTCALLLGPWHLRNAHRAGYAGFSTLGEHALYISAAGSVIAQREGQPYLDVRLERYALAAAPGPSPYAMMRAEGWATVRSDLPGYAKTHAAGALRTLLEPGAVEYLRLFGHYPAAGGFVSRASDAGLLRALRELSLAHPLAFWSTLALGLVVLPLVVLPLFAVRLMPLAALVVVYFVVAGGGVPGSSRFRAPVAPLLVVMSVAGLSRLRAPATLAP